MRGEGPDVWTARNTSLCNKEEREEQLCAQPFERRNAQMSSSRGQELIRKVQQLLLAGRPSLFISEGGGRVFHLIRRTSSAFFNPRGVHKEKRLPLGVDFPRSLLGPHIKSFESRVMYNATPYFIQSAPLSLLSKEGKKKFPVTLLDEYNGEG